MIKRALLALLALLVLALPAQAQRLVADLSDHHISLSSSFTGTEIIVFGTIENIPEGNEGPFDIAVVVQGPPRT